MDVFIVLIVVLVSRASLYLKIDATEHVLYVNSHMNKAVTRS